MKPLSIAQTLLFYISCRLHSSHCQAAIPPKFPTLPGGYLAPKPRLAQNRVPGVGFSCRISLSCVNNLDIWNWYLEARCPK